MCDCEFSETFQTHEYLNIKNYSIKKRLIGRLELGCEYEKFNSTETSPDDKNVIEVKIATALFTLFCWYLYAFISNIDFY